MTVLGENNEDKTEDYIKSLQLKPLLPSDKDFDKELLEMVSNIEDLEVWARVILFPSLKLDSLAKWLAC